MGRDCEVPVITYSYSWPVSTPSSLFSLAMEILFYSLSGIMINKGKGSEKDLVREETVLFLK